MTRARVIDADAGFAPVIHAAIAEALTRAGDRERSSAMSRACAP